MRKITPTVLFRIYRECLIHSIKILFKNWQIIPASLIMSLAFFLVIAPLLSPFGLVGGLVLGLLAACVFTFFYGWVARLVNREKLVINELTQFDYQLFLCIINTGFVLWIVRMLVDTFTKGDVTMTLLLNFAVILLCNPLPEVLYQKRIAGLEALNESFQFTQSNWHIWFLPFILLLSPLLLGLGAQATLRLFGSGTDLLPTLVILYLGGMLASDIFGLVFGVIILVWFTLFRGFLFLRLEGSLFNRYG